MAQVVLLRGVNVGGHRTFKPSELAKRLAHLDLVNLGAAGTFVVRAPIKQEQLRKEFAQKLPFQAEIVICQGRDIVKLHASDPFAEYPAQRDIVQIVSVLAGNPVSGPELPLDLPASGPWQLKLVAREKRFVLGMYHRRMKAIGLLGKLDGIFGVPVTTRNWNTIGSIVKVLAEGG